MSDESEFSEESQQPDKIPSDIIANGRIERKEDDPTASAYISVEDDSAVVKEEDV